MTVIQNRTSEFQSILQSASRQQKLSSQRQSLLTPAEKQAASGQQPNGARQRSEFASQAAAISKGISVTMERLARLAALARNRSLFADNSVESSELIAVIKQSLSRLNSDLGALQALSKQGNQTAAKVQADQVGKHNEGVVVLLRTRLGDVTSR